MILYKLTDEKGQTYNNTQWAPGVTHTTSGKGELCGSGWLHAYEHPLLAVLHNPIQGDLDPTTMQLWEATTTDTDPLRDGQMKLGIRNLTTTRRLKIPSITMEQRVVYAIRCAKMRCRNHAWNVWADAWLAGEDRSKAAAAEARAAEAAEAVAEAWAATRAAEAWAEEAAVAVAVAALEVVRARAALEVAVAVAALEVVRARAAETMEEDINLIALAEEACGSYIPEPWEDK